MKLHLPVSLRKCLLSVLVAVAAFTCVPAQAGIMHEDAYLSAYTDFGQNRGRYVVGTRVNALLEHIRKQDGGITIEYKDGTPTYKISNEQGMIDFRGAPDVGHSALIGNNFLVTVNHNGTLNYTFSGDDVGQDYAMRHSSVDIRGSSLFRLTPSSGFDYAVQRQNRLVTDAVSTPLLSVSMNNMASLKGQLMYHVGSGSMGVYTEADKVYNSYCGAYVYNIGDIVEINSYGANDQTGEFTVGRDPGFGDGKGASESNPLPSALRAGDSGSPMFYYNADKERYEFLAVEQSGNAYSADYGRGSVEWTKEQLARFDVAVSMSDSVHEVHLGAIKTQGDTRTDNLGNSTTLYSGQLTDATGTISYKGIESGSHTWKDMSGLRNTDTWYAYNSQYYDEGSNPDGYLLQKNADLFFTENLVFSSTAEQNTIVLDATVDLGVGYAEFKNGSYTIQSASDTTHQFDHAGYVIHEGAEVHLKLTNPADYMREWRKTGAGDLYIEGSGDTNAFLNLGGSGTTYLRQQEKAHAAYNVLVNMGARVEIASTTQIERDLTFGSGGGTLDMKGNSMEWYTTNGQTRENAFTINALTEEAMITNSAAEDVTLTYKQGDKTTWLGSFTDSAAGALLIDYQGGGTWTLNSIHTDLSKNVGSGLHVTDGTVVFSGVNTIHGWGSATGRSKDRLVEVKDWHYADAKMNVTVKNGGKFELGSHAHLEGNVTVESGGTFIMHEGVQHAKEYIEGGTTLQSTADISAFYGLKGDVSLAEDAAMRVEFSQDTTVANSYDRKISGAGSLTVDLGAADKKFILSGDNSGHTGAKELASGYLVAETLKSLGDTSSNTWKMTGVDAVISAHEGTAKDLLDRVDGGSVGTLALSGDTEGALNLSGHKGLFIGAEEGKEVHYGQSDVSLDAVDGKWQFGGGGGVLYVDFKLSDANSGANNLVLGVSQTASGTVVLNNSANDFSGDIKFSGKGLILKSVAGGLGRATLDLNYGNALGASSTDEIKNLKAGSNGILLVDDLNNANVDLSAYAGLALGAQNEKIYSGNITLAEGADYHFSAAAGGSLTVETVLDAGRNIVVDGQGLTGGKVVLNGNTTLNGDLVVRGNADAGSHGDMTFALGRDLITTGAVTVENGGVIDLAGRNLSISGALSGTGGSIIDSSGHAELNFSADEADVSSAAYMDLATVRKTGARNFTLTNDNVNIDNLYVEEGRVTMGSGTRSMTVHLADGTHVDVGTHTAQFDLNMALNGGVAELKHSGNTGKVTLAGNITLGGGSKLNLHGGTGVTYALNGSSYGGGNAVLSVNADKVEFNTQSTTILGTLRAEKNLEIYSNASGELERSIAQLDIANNSTVTLNERTWKTIWNIDSLTGEGNLYWKSNTTHDYTSRLILKGDGGFSGTISLDRNRTDKANRTHGAFIELASDTAAKNAVISLSGERANSVASLAVNTLNATIKGLVGNEHSYVYAGESMDAAELSGDSRPPSTRNATLVVNVDSGKEYTYKGTLGAGLELIKTGAGTQNLTGTIAARNVAVWDGVLDVSAADIRGRIAIGLGATLNAGDHLVLGAGQVLSAMQGMEGVYSSASLSGSLTLDGGSLGFDAHALLAANSQGNAAISLDSIAIGNGGGVIHFDNYTSLSAGVTYTLASGQGDWSGLTDQLSSSGLGFYSATYSSGQNGELLVTLNLNDNAKVWNGKEGASTWANYSFGQTEMEFGMDGNSVAVFDDTAEVKVVDIERNFRQASISKIFITGGSDYTFRSDNPSLKSVATQSLTHSSTGTTVIEAGFAVNGETVIENGTMVLKGLNQLRGSISGAGTLAIDWADYVFDWNMGDEYTMYALNIQGLDTLHVKSGGYGHADSGSIVVNNVILEQGTSFTQSKNTDLVTNMVTKEAAAVHLNDGTLGGSWKQEGNSSINVSGDAYLNSRLTQNGHQLTQGGGGTLHIGADSAAVLQNYKISSGILRYDSGAMSEGNGTLEVAGGTLHVQNGAGLEASLIKVSGGKLQVDSSASLMGNTALHLSNADATATLESYNSYTGGTTIDAGTLEVTANGGLGTGAVSINGGSLVVGAAARGALSSISGLSMSGGTLNLSAIPFNAFDAMELNGAFSVSGGTINLGSLSATGTSYAIFDISNATFDWSLDALAENLMVNGTLLSSYKDKAVTLGVNDGMATITFSSFDLDRLDLNSGDARSFTETELINYTTDIIVNEGATLTMTDKVTAENATSTAFDKVSGAGKVVLTLAADNGVGFNLSGITGTVEVTTGRLQVNTSTFNEASTIVLAAAGAELVFNGTGTDLKNNVELKADTIIHVNNNKSGTISGSLSGKALTKKGSGTLTLSGNSSIEWLTVLDGSVKIDGTLNLTAQKGGEVAVTGITGAGTLGLNFTGDYANTLSVAGGFTGTTHLQSGKFTFKDAAFGGSLRMAGGTGIQATADTTVAGSLAMDGAAEVKVADGKTLQVNGATSAASATLTKDGTGALVLNGAVKLVNVNTKAGMLTVANSGSEGNAITTLDQTAGTLCVAEDAKLHIGTVNTNSNAGVVLKHGAELTIASSGPVITNRGTVDARLKAISNGSQYTVGNSNIEIINAHVANRKTGDTTLSNKLTNSSVENAGGATLTVSNSANTLTGVVASKGNVTLHHMGAAMSLDLLEIAAGKTVNAYVGTNAAEKTTTTTVTGSALLSGTATLNTSLTLEAGATLDMTGLEAGAVTLSGALTFGGQVTMGDKLLGILSEMSGWEESVTLFTGLTDLVLPAVAADDAADRLWVGDVFSNLAGNENYYFNYVPEVGSLAVVHVPEPTTSTLSLLTLAALAARRRRK